MKKLTTLLLLALVLKLTSCDIDKDTNDAPETPKDYKALAQSHAKYCMDNHEHQVEGYGNHITRFYTYECLLEYIVKNFNGNAATLTGAISHNETGKITNYDINTMTVGAEVPHHNGDLSSGNVVSYCPDHVVEHAGNNYCENRASVLTTYPDGSTNGVATEYGAQDVVFKFTTIKLHGNEDIITK